MIISNVSKLVEGKKLPKITPISTVKNACKMMAEYNSRALVVLNKKQLVGVISERDVVRKCVAKGLDVRETKVADIMTSEIQVVNAGDGLARAIEIMQQGKFHQVPVIDGENILGLISSDDIPDEYRMLLERFKEMKKA